MDYSLDSLDCFVKRRGFSNVRYDYKRQFACVDVGLVKGSQSGRFGGRSDGGFYVEACIENSAEDMSTEEPGAAYDEGHN